MNKKSKEKKVISKNEQKELEEDLKDLKSLNFVQKKLQFLMKKF